MTDKNGNTLNPGDTVTLTCTVKALLDSSDACDLRLITAENMPCSAAPQNLLTNHLCVEKVIATEPAAAPAPVSTPKAPNAAPATPAAPSTPTPTV